ncbi:hypothetical protein FRC08_011470, partial [Ceratobasidium sp. 394]
MPGSPPSIDVTDAEVPVARPRRVQWASQTGAHSPPGHALDEHALDPTAFAQLRLALEEHRANPDVAQPSTAPSTAPTTPVLGNAHRELDLDVYIAPGETDGLPRADTTATVERRASRLVKAHQQGRFGGFLRRRKPRDATTAEDEGDVEKRAHASQARPASGNLAIGPGTGGGVLSSLLALYDHHNMRSGQSTPSHELTDDQGENPFFKDDERGKEHPPDPPAGYFHNHGHAHAHRRTRSSPAAGPSTSGSNSGTNSNATPNAPGPSSAGFTLSLPKALKPSHRPAAARSSAGVFGGLIASTGNIAGAAAPAASTLGPETKRPGYHLSRYSVEDTPKTKSNKLPRTTSSSGATSPSGDITPPHPPFATLDGPLRFDTSTSVGHSRSRSTSDLTTSNTAINSGAPLGLINTSTKGANSKRASMTLGSLPLPGWVTPGSWTPGRTTPGTDEGGPVAEWAKADGEEKRRRRRREKKKRQEVYITMHVAEILQRHEFILKLARALMMFGAPSHRLEAQIQATARVLDIQVSC